MIPSALTGGTIDPANYDISYVNGDIVIGSANISVTGTLAALNTTYGIASAATNFTVQGTGLLNNITVTPPTGFEVSLSSSGSFGDQVVLSPSGGTLAATPIYLRSKATAAAGTYAGSITIASAGAASVHYPIATSTVSKAILTVTANNVSKNYGSVLTGASGSTAFTSSGLQNGETIGTVNIAYGTGAAANSGVNNYTASVVPSAAAGGTFNSANYTITYNAGNITVNAVPLSITATNVTKTYGQVLTDDPNSASFTVSGLQNADAISTVSLTYGTGGAATAAFGTYNNVITPSAAAGAAFNAGNYIITYHTGNITVNKASLTIIATNKSKTYGQLLTGGSGSTGFAVTGLQNSETVGSVAITYGTGAATNAPVGAYTGSVTPSFATGGTFTAGNYSITYQSGNIVVDKANLIITANNKSKTYGDVLTSETGSTAFSASGSLNGETIGAVNITYGAGADVTATVGNYTAQVIAAGAAGGTFNPDNYNINYIPGDINISAMPIAVAAVPNSKTYGDTDPALMYMITSGTLLSGDAFSGTLSRDAGEDVGNYTITQGTLALNSNYDLHYTGANLTIGKKTINVSATAKSKTYGDADPVLTYTNDGLVGADVFTGTLDRDAGENAGSYTIRQGSLALGDNYTLNYRSADLNIGARTIAVSAAAQAKTYGDTDPALTYTITSGVLQGTDAFGGSLVRDGGEHAGSYAIKQGSLVLSSNYDLAFTPASLTISPKTLTVTANDQTRLYGVGNPTFTVSYNGFANGDTPSSLTTAATATSTASISSPAGTYLIVAAGAAANDYTFSYINGTLTITGATLTITANNLSKAYGVANPALTLNYSGFVNGDTPAKFTSAPVVSTTATALSGAGNYPITVSGAAIPGYIINYVPGTLTVNKAIVNVTADNKTRAYGTANPVLTVSYSGFVNGDTPTSLTTPATAATNAVTASLPGNYAIIAGGAASANYNFTYASGTLTVTPLTNSALANLTISPGTLSPIYTPSVTNYTAQVGNDVTGISITATPADATASVKINGAAAGNGVPSSLIPLIAGNNTITVVVTAQDGITRSTYAITVYRAAAPEQITATNILTPNGDGKNDNWVIKDIASYPNNTVTIYDVAGRVVYSKHGYSNDWNGTVKGAPLNPGTYYYTIDLGVPASVIKGFITLLKSQN